MESQEVEPPDGVITNGKLSEAFQNSDQCSYGKHVLAQQLVRASYLQQLDLQLSLRALLEKLLIPQEWSTPLHQSSQLP